MMPYNHHYCDTINKQMMFFYSITDKQPNNRPDIITENYFWPTNMTTTRKSYRTNERTISTALILILNISLLEMWRRVYTENIFILQKLITYKHILIRIKSLYSYNHIKVIIKKSKQIPVG